MSSRLSSRPWRRRRPRAGSAFKADAHRLGGPLWCSADAGVDCVPAPPTTSHSQPPGIRGRKSMLTLRFLG